MPTAKDMVIEWIREILGRRNWTGTDLAKKAEMSPSTILRLMNDMKHDFTPSIRTLTKISQASGSPIPRRILDAMGVYDSVDQGGSSGNTATAVRRLTALPAKLRDHPTTTSHTSTPPQLKGDPSLFAFTMFNSDLEPALQSGALVFATRRRDPIAGDTVLLTDKRGLSRVRFLLDISEAGLRLSRSIPMKEEELVSFDDIDDLAIIAGSFARV
jgi:transcriptional regulator with XRE-family HTH domain